MRITTTTMHKLTRTAIHTTNTTNTRTTLCGLDKGRTSTLTRMRRSATATRITQTPTIGTGTEASGHLAIHLSITNPAARYMA